MENAVKALLIAAAVLIAILIISMVMGVFNMGAEQIENAGDLSEYEIQSFNDKFTQYEGDSVTGSRVNALLKTVFNHNMVQDDNNVKITMGTGASRLADDATESAANKVVVNTNTMSDKYSTGRRYTVTCFYNSSSNLVDHIQVTANT